MIPVNNKTHSNIYSIALHVTTNNRIPERDAVLTFLHSKLKISVVNLIKTPKGYKVKVDSLAHVDIILANPSKLKSINLFPLTPPRILAERTVLVRGVDDALGKLNPADIKKEIIAKNNGRHFMPLSACAFRSC